MYVCMHVYNYIANTKTHSNTATNYINIGMKSQHL